ncbi:chorismate mutase [Dongia sp.]|uniref:chorismate mutase n=1 Tax=Dongia sp. TaxID=1977262 RepID=UPI0035AEECEC
MADKTISGRRKACKDMNEVREAIDALDRQIVALLADRLHFINEAGRLKASRDAVRDEARVEDVVAKVRQAATSAGIDPDFVEPLYRDLVERSIGHEFNVFDRLHKS